MNSLKFEIVQERPFSSPREEAFLGLLRTADCLQRAFHLRIRGWGLTATQYNVLRILRGAHPGGLTCAAIGSRMITAVPDITRLLGRLSLPGYVRRRRDKQDRRVVWTEITPAGLDLLEQMNPLIAEIPGLLLGELKDEEVAWLIALLEAARRGCAPPVSEPAPRP